MRGYAGGGLLAAGLDPAVAFFDRLGLLEVGRRDHSAEVQSRNGPRFPMVQDTLCWQRIEHGACGMQIRRPEAFRPAAKAPEPA